MVYILNTWQHNFVRIILAANEHISLSKHVKRHKSFNILGILVCVGEIEDVRMSGDV